MPGTLVGRALGEPLKELLGDEVGVADDADVGAVVRADPGPVRVDVDERYVGEERPLCVL